MELKKNSVWTGLVSGLLLPPLSFCILYLVLKENYTFIDFFNRAIDLHVITKFLSISVIPNLLLFFLFIRKDFLLSARGVLGATLLEAFLILMLQSIL